MISNKGSFTQPAFNYPKEALITLYLLLFLNLYIERLFDLGFSVSNLAYITLFLTLTASLIIIARIANTLIRIIVGFILYISASTEAAYENIAADTMNYNTFISLLNAHSSAGDAWTQYSSSIISNALFALLLLIGLVLKPRKKATIRMIFIACVPFFLLVSILFLRGGDGAKALPKGYTILAYSTLSLYEAANDKLSLQTRSQVQLEREGKKINQDIVLIIDESIAANYLNINSAVGVPTALDKSNPEYKINNFGYAASIANCSHETNLTLRYGGTRENYLGIIATMPSIWEYAKNANMRTVYIDAQRTHGELQNGMTESEKQHIDKFIQFNEIPVLERDIAASEELVNLINNNQPDFIIMNKVGAHFPIHDKYPDNYLKYKPVLQRGGFKNISDTGSRTGFSGSEVDWQYYRNSYKNTLLWNVGEFFNNIFKKANLNKATLIYTSDHGQDLHENGREGLYAHCSKSPAMEEGLVPLVIIEGSSLNSLNWNVKQNKNNSSHYNIFPTLLSLMHYNKSQINSFYGKSLDLITNDDMTFNAHFHARLGTNPKWVKVRVN